MLTLARIGGGCQLEGKLLHQTCLVDVASFMLGEAFDSNVPIRAFAEHAILTKERCEDQQHDGQEARSGFSENADHAQTISRLDTQAQPTTGAPNGRRSHELT